MEHSEDVCKINTLYLNLCSSSLNIFLIHQFFQLKFVYSSVYMLDTKKVGQI